MPSLSASSTARRSDRAGRRSPLQGFAESAVGPGGRRRLPDGPRRVAPPLGALSVRRSSVSGPPLPPRRGVRPRGVPSAGLLRTGVRSGSRRLGPLSGRSIAVPGPGITAETIPSWGFLPLRRRGLTGPLFPGLPPPARSVLEVSHLLDGLLPARFAATRAAAVHGVHTPIRGRFGHRAVTLPRCRGCAASRSIARRVSAPPALRNRR
jgi:hypothetical protein